MGILSGLSGCGKTSGKRKKHDVSEISRLSMACSHMCRTFGYSFILTREGESWLFDADCFTRDHTVETNFSGKVVNCEEMDSLFEILEHNNTISYVQNYKKPMKLPFHVMDETIYHVCISFSDGSQYVTASAGTALSELEQFFYCLAQGSD